MTTATLDRPRTAAPSKVPHVAAAFWAIKILATTLGETGADAFSQGLNWGYVATTAMFGAFFAAALALQLRARDFAPWRYWLVVVATTTVGTTIADFLDRDVGIGYLGGSLILFALVLISLAVWHARRGRIQFAHVADPKDELHYWLTIFASNTLGTALGDWVADSGPGYEGGALIFGGMILLVALLAFATKLPRAGLFWAAFILTRPLGATVGDFLDKPIVKGGMNLDRFAASGVILGLMLILIVLTERRRRAARD